jgi:hypothetical protein
MKTNKKIKTFNGEKPEIKPFLTFSLCANWMERENL